MFDLLVKEVASRFSLSTATVSTLVREVLSVMTSQRTGGVEGFMDLFRRAGLGDTVSSWFGGKADTPITTTQLESALGAGTLDKLAGSAGLSRGAAASALAYLLPKLIGQLTPGGSLPTTSGLLSQVSSYLARPARESVARSGGMPRWLPWAVVALLGFVGWMWLRGPSGTINPQLTVNNNEGRVTYSGLVRDEATRVPSSRPCARPLVTRTSRVTSVWIVM